MEATALHPFTAWETFYVIVGSSAAALTGLQFVVIALSAESRALRSPELLAFGTPTIVHFCEVLLVSAILSAPWETLSGAGVSLVICGAVGVAYTIIVVVRTHRQTGYKPELEDWLWHTSFPLIAYVTLLAAAATLPQHPPASLFVIAATVLLLLFTGIHNAWDAATYIAMRPKEP